MILQHFDLLLCICIRLRGSFVDHYKTPEKSKSLLNDFIDLEPLYLITNNRRFLVNVNLIKIQDVFGAINKVVWVIDHVQTLLSSCHFPPPW